MTECQGISLCVITEDTASDKVSGGKPANAPGWVCLSGLFLRFSPYGSSHELQFLPPFFCLNITHIQLYAGFDHFTFFAISNESEVRMVSFFVASWDEDIQDKSKSPEHLENLIPVDGSRQITPKAKCYNHLSLTCCLHLIVSMILFPCLALSIPHSLLSLEASKTFHCLMFGHFHLSVYKILPFENIACVTFPFPKKVSYLFLLWFP